MRASKTAVVLLVVALLTVTAVGSAFAAPNVSDVPKGHWAYDAVVRLVEEGYIELSGDVFDGSGSVDRYTLAAVVAKVLDQVAAGETAVSQEDVALLRELTTEFRDELVAWYEEKDELKAKVDELDKTAEAVKQQVYESVDYLTNADSELQEEVATIRSSLQASDANTAAVVSALQSEDEILAASIQEVDSRVERVDGTVLELSGAVDGLQSSVAEHARLLDQAQTEINANKDGLAKQSVELAAAVDAIMQLENLLDVNVENRFQEREMALTMVKDDLAQADAKLQEVLESQNVDLRALADQVGNVESKLGTAIAEQESGLSQLQQEVEGAAQALAELNQTQEANDLRFADQAERIEGLQAQVDGYQSRLSELKSEVDLLRQRFITVEDTVVRIGKVVTQLDEELGRDLDTNISMALQRYRVLEQDVASLQEEVRLQKARSLEEIEQMKKTNSFLMLGGGLAIILLFVLGQ